MVLSPTKGLQLLSLDDAVNADREMNSASEMNNCISAGNAFRLIIQSSKWMNQELCSAVRWLL